MREMGIVTNDKIFSSKFETSSAVQCQLSDICPISPPDQSPAVYRLDQIRSTVGFKAINNKLTTKHGLKYVNTEPS